MAATRSDIDRWFDRGVQRGTRYMVVMCDTYDYEDYPVYCKDDKEARAKMANPGPMQRVMECYDLQESKSDQLSVGRCWALPRHGNT